MTQRARYERRRRRAFHKFIHEDRPYAVWTLMDGTQILVNREYRPLMRRQPGQPAEPAEQRWYDDILTEQWIDDPPSWEPEDDYHFDLGFSSAGIDHARYRSRL